MKKIEEIKKRFKELEEKLSDQKIISDNKELTKVAKEHSSLKKTFDLIIELEKIEEDLLDNHSLIKESKDPELTSMAKEDIVLLEKRKLEAEESLEDEINPADPNDKRNAIMEIRAGAGGDEGALFTAELFRAYSKFAEKMGWKVEMLSSSEIGIGGLKEVIFSIQGDGAYGNLKYEAGTHRVQRVPETEKQGRVHTSTSTVVVLPEAEEVDIDINPSDIRIDTFCSSGPGGQSVNTTQSAIRVTHEPTGLVASCQDQKSQHQNKEKAMQILRSRLLAKIEEEKIANESKERVGQIGKGDRSDKIRTYNFPQSRITDHRINKSWHSIDDFMNGNIDEVIKELRKNK
jgi:peptide chain release factor 1